MLSLLSAETGLRIAGPDFDPHYQHSGGYGYTWFRDDAEISTFLLDADDRLGVGLDDWHERSARMYAATQRPDGSWPHRVWPRNGALAPGWANARIEDGVDEARLDRLVEHVETVVDGLAHETDAISGLIRYEGDSWRQAGQDSEKVWTVSTAWGANACAELAVLLAEHDDHGLLTSDSIPADD